jgi:hypothetical protein
LGTTRMVARPINGTSQRDVSSRLSLMGRSPIQGGFRVRRSRISWSRERGEDRG